MPPEQVTAPELKVQRNAGVQTILSGVKKILPCLPASFSSARPETCQNQTEVTYRPENSCIRRVLFWEQGKYMDHLPNSIESYPRFCVFGVTDMSVTSQWPRDYTGLIPPVRYVSPLTMECSEILNFTLIFRKKSSTYGTFLKCVQSSRLYILLL